MRDSEGWEIEWRDPLNYPHWELWDGKGWSVRWQFRGRPRQPAMKKVKILAYMHIGIGDIIFRFETEEISNRWIRIPSEDKEIEVPA